MICDLERFSPAASAGVGQACGLRRLSEVLPAIMARYDLRPVTAPRDFAPRDVPLCSPVVGTLDAVAAG